MNAKFLVVKVDSEGSFEYPIKVCENFTLKETDNCTVYAINEDGTIGEIVKDFENYSDEGFALIDVGPDEDENPNNWIVIEKVSVKTREDFIKTKQYKEWREKYFKDDEEIENYERSILHSGNFCATDYNDENETHWYAITEYEGNTLYYPY